MSNPSAWEAIGDLEGDDRDVARWGQVVSTMAEAQAHGSKPLITVAYAIVDLGKKLTAQWEAAMDAARQGDRR
ncbi:hypothetical protein FV232_10425 [Methylobacterium sp. WL30]|jgi:imidazoleglycerol phosphate dehydratase HisB|uniref:hypothetical protein n=1 Tax=unclassified Methylobacterium TaxID=2615210 RepID=UPI0011C84125|nr:MULTISPECIES: hypothetical protein [unclassified Methylobacterium]TXM93700.1 hypothetical protein FV223_07425 [Methylobacterium sp. WL116]TXN38626.1 hypothetical protein FV225_13040 [Methylobacterium sp. WL93]TXN50167.1 hypothetical protein FV227_13440 [Methylobacterium sp. WL119]TXN67901.1 hypothetical protein FV232_10425 [Methylobacterium sp. WL30]